jgi:hypothetical protein
MRLVRFSLLLLCLLILNRQVCAQQTQPPTTTSPAPQDPQAIIVLNQTLALSGGLSAFNAVTDYQAFGNVTYHWNPEEQGPVTIQGLGLGDIRTDASLPSGMQSESIHDGQTSWKSTKGILWQYPSLHPVPSSDAMPYQPPLFPSCLVLPQMQIATALTNPWYSISYKGVSQIDGQSVHQVEVRLALPEQTQPDNMTEYLTVTLFIDTLTLQLIMTQDIMPNHIVHQTRYSDYRLVNGVLVPFSISEQLGSQKTRNIQLSQISFNTGLQSTAFVLQ